MLVPARLGLCAESGLCREPRKQHDVANSAALATQWSGGGPVTLASRGSVVWRDVKQKRSFLAGCFTCSHSQREQTLCVRPLKVAFSPRSAARLGTRHVTARTPLSSQLAVLFPVRVRLRRRCRVPSRSLRYHRSLRSMPRIPGLRWVGRHQVAGLICCSTNERTPATSAGAALRSSAVNSGICS